MKLWLISDTHGKHGHLDVPKDIDMIIHAGDGGTYRGAHLCKPDLENCLHWFDSLDVKYKIYVPGNHDTAMEAGLINIEDYPTVTFLNHETEIVGGLKIFGSPWTPYFHDWAYNAVEEDLEYLWMDIPGNLDILITHGPPAGILDRCQDGYRAGCHSLKDRIGKVKPKIHVFGHIHEDGGKVEEGKNTKFFNASVVNLAYSVSNNGHIIEI